jgi:hypothetical protein
MNPVKDESTTQAANVEELRRLLFRGERGDRSVLPELRQFLDATPRMWELHGDVSRKAEEALARLAAGDDLVLSECLMRKQAALRAELAGSEASALEQSLADRVAICSLAVGYFDCLLGRSEGRSMESIEPLRRHLDAAHRRFLSAAKTLAEVRRLLRRSPSPLQIATSLQGDTSPVGTRRERRPAGVSLEN